ncbi:hypothetical protein Bca4012_068556 [Brassica carinata]
MKFSPSSYNGQPLVICSIAISVVTTRNLVSSGIDVLHLRFSKILVSKIPLGVRPPGHHAGIKCYGVFAFTNNPAVAALVAQEAGGKEGVDCGLGCPSWKWNAGDIPAK